MVSDHLQSINQLNYMLNLNHFWDPGALLFRDQVLSLGPGSISYLQCDLGHHLPVWDLNPRPQRDWSLNPVP